MTEEEKTDPVVETPEVAEQVPVEAPAEVPAETPAQQVEAPAEPVAVEPEPVPQLEPLKLDSVKPKGPRVPLPSSLQEIVGALLFASESPLTPTELRTCVRGVAPEEGEDAEVMSVYQSCTSREIEQALRGLEKELERSGCGFHLVCAGGAYRLQTVPSCGRYVRALLKLDRPNRLSRAALETLAIIAYRQPITKAEIEQIRGVAVDTIVKSLVDLQLVRLVGRSELPGHPFLYGTSPIFLEHFGLSSLSELNEIDPTLQRSNPRERAKLFVKEKKVEEKPTEEKVDADGQAEGAPEIAAEPAVPRNDGVKDDGTVESTDVVDEDGGVVDGEEVASRRVSFRPDEDEEEPLIDDTPDEFDDDDDEPLLDEDEADDEFDDDDDDEEEEDDDEE